MLYADEICHPRLLKAAIHQVVTTLDGGAAKT